MSNDYTCATPSFFTGGTAVITPGGCSFTDCIDPTPGACTLCGGYTPATFTATFVCPTAGTPFCQVSVIGGTGSGSVSYDPAVFQGTWTLTRTGPCTWTATTGTTTFTYYDVTGCSGTPTTVTQACIIAFTITTGDPCYAVGLSVTTADGAYLLVDSAYIGPADPYADYEAACDGYAGNQYVGFGYPLPELTVVVTRC